MNTRWKRIRTAIAILIAIASVFSFRGAAGAGAPPPPTLTTLQPGGFREFNQQLEINVVFIGYEAGAGVREINETAFLSELPVAYHSIDRMPSFYFGNQFNGLNFTFSYDLIYADSAFEDAFFAYLGSIASPMPLTVYQAQYNSQNSRSLDVTDNAWIDAPSVEYWLLEHGYTDLGVDPDQYTVYFINWFGRPDFRFHVYTKTGEPDPDTGRDYGVFYDSYKLIAWGGTQPADEESGDDIYGAGCPWCVGKPHRLWFYDLSAGPEAWTNNWNLEDADLDGSGAMDYRMPPVWEYGNLSAYRPFDNLSSDLGKVTRYVAIDMLFTPSPLYKTAISPPQLPADLELDINVFQMDPSVDGIDYFDLGMIASEVNELQPLNNVSVELNSYTPTNRFNEIYTCFQSYFDDNDSCYGNRLYNISFGDLFLYFQDHLMSYLEGEGDYEIPIFAFAIPNALSVGLGGYADDNWRDGTQSYIFQWSFPASRARGAGFSHTTIHETGHHLGLSHPHDGFDYEANVDFSQTDDFYFVWSGDEANSVMSYLRNNQDFGQFNQDSMNRGLTTNYLNQANAILEDIYANPNAGQVSSLLLSADWHAAQAVAAYAVMDYALAAEHARQAYGQVLQAAGIIQVKVEPQAWQADYRARGVSDKFIDRTDDHYYLP